MNSIQMLVVTMALLLAASASRVSADPVHIVVHPSQILRKGADRFVGLNLNYIRDSDINRPGAASLDSALSELGTRWLRYPGGEKSDYALWSVPPFTHPAPQSLGWYATISGHRMDIDEYMSHVHKAHAEPYVVVGFSTLKSSGKSEAEWIENATTLVHYANTVRHYHIRYWEIGNENWNNQKGTPEQLAAVVNRFSVAMKAVDPSIRVGASGNNDSWWSKFLPIAGPHLDFVNLSLYNAWGWRGYQHFIDHPGEDIVGDAETTVEAIRKYAAPGDQKRLSVVVSETNSKDYSDAKTAWTDENSLGHAIVTFDTLGQLMKLPKVDCAMVWTSRWMNDLEAPTSQWYALGASNQIMPTGRALFLWGQFVRSNLVATSGDTTDITSFATANSQNAKTTTWIINRGGRGDIPVGVAVEGGALHKKTRAYVLRGTSPNDSQPIWQNSAIEKVAGAEIGVICPPASVTVVVED